MQEQEKFIEKVCTKQRLAVAITIRLSLVFKSLLLFLMVISYVYLIMVT